MELFGSFYRRKLRRKQKRSELGRSDGALCKLPAETGVNGLISKVLRFTSRRSEPGSRPHSWHSTKLGEGPLDSDSMMQITQGNVGAPWHQSYHASASTTDLSSYDAGFLRKSPDQYSSRGSMESLDHPHPGYSSCNQLSVSKSSNSIDHLHSKRDSAYSSFSTSSSIPEYLTAGPSITKERSYSMDSVPQHKTAEGMNQADIRYVRTVYDSQQGVSKEHEVPSSVLVKTVEGKAQSRSGIQGGVWQHGNSSGSSGSSASTATSHRHSAGPVWGQTHNHNSYENLTGVPSPPLRSDSFAAFRNHERPNSWSSLEQARSLRALQKGSWHHSSGSVASGKSSFGIEGQLHTVIEKSPESSPTIKPKQNFPASSQPGLAMLPTGMYPVSLPEPHFAQIPNANPSSASMYPALLKENKHIPQRENGEGSDSGVLASHSSSVQPKESNQVQGDPQTKFMFYRPHFQTQGSNSTVPCTVQDRKDPYTTVQPRRDMMESYRQPREEEPSRNKEHNVYPQKPEVLQGHVVQAHESDQRVSSLGKYHSDFNTHQQRDQDLDHPLTRLENALAEVQRCASPQSTASHCSAQSERAMSVMEKVSHFERQQVKPRSYSSLSSYSSSAVSSQVTRGDKRSLNSLEDLQNHCLSQGRSWSSSHEGKPQAQQDMHPRYGSTNQSQHRKPNDLQRSKSFFQLSENNDNNFHRSKSIFHLGEENSRDVQLKDDLHGILGTGQETTFNRAYRESIKDAQSKVLRSTSFRRRDLSVNPPPVPEKHAPVERKAAQTNPNPKISTSPHTPKERHIVPVEVPDRNMAPELPRVPPVGPSVMRICGRKRLTMEQKKRSYSEPENMNEVGVSDQRSGPFQRNTIQPFQFPEASVADRRRMFELVASRNASSKLTTSRPELKQMQQEALADYVERKTGRRMDGHQHRPQSACIQSVTSSSIDIHSLGSTPSLCSLQQPGQEGVSSALTANMKRLMQPNRSTQTQTKSEIYHSGYNPQGQTAEPQKPEKEPERPFLVDVPARASDHLPSTSGAFQRTVPSRRSGKSTSAEDLLDRTEDRHVAQHSRSRSSPAVENYSRDFSSEELTMSGIVSKENSALGSEQISSGQVHMEKNPGPYQSNPPVKRRERQRYSDRPRAHSASGLAASVGLPCPFSPPEWHDASERQCQPNLDSITFPGTVHEQLADALRDMEKAACHPSPSPLQGTVSQTPFSFDQIPQSCLSEPSAAAMSLVSPIKSLPSLRISESSIHFGPSSAVTQEDDDVFLTPSSSLSPPLASSEANIMEDLPCTSVQPERKQESPHVAWVQETQTLNSFSERPSITTPHHETDKQLQDLSSLSAISNQNSTKVTTGMVSVVEADVASESLSLKLPLLVRRQRTEAEVQVEALARELVCNDEALAPLLDSWASTSTLDLMEDIFFSRSWCPLHSGESSISHTGDSAAQVVQAAAKTPAKPFGIETDLDEEENNLKQKKMELVHALATSLEILQVERSSLAEEQQHFGALGGRMEALIQQHCKPNESEKYRMFIGDLEKIVNLLLSLSGRLARVENALSALGEEPDKGSAEEKASLQQKQQQLRSQQEDARELKENLDRREQIVLQFLGGYLSKAELTDYQSYIRTKPALLIRQRHLDELIQQGEEQLRRLSENTTPEAYPHLDSTRSSPTDGSNSPRPTTVTSL